MKLPRKAGRRLESGQEMLPLINIAFLLMVFFMLMGTVGAARPLRADVPQAQGGGALHAAASRLSFEPSGHWRLDGERLDEVALAAAMQRWKDAHGDAALLVEADAAAPANVIVQALFQARAAGIGRAELLVRATRR